MTTIPALAIDLNSDMGESDAPAQIATDESLLGLITSANIACGGHAGDDHSMARTIRAAIARGVSIGAHPSFPDRANFGRTDMDLPAADIERTVADQIRALDRIARQHGARLSHVKPHGALYHAAMTRPHVADAIAHAVASIDERLTLVGLAGAPGLARWQLLGRPIAAEAFADRRYEPDGALRARSKDDALITDLEDASAQAIDIASGDGVTSTTGTLVPVRASTICIHSDTPGALAVATAVRRALLDAHIRIAPMASSAAPR